MELVGTAEQRQLAEAEQVWLSRHDPIVRIRAALDSDGLRIDPAAVAHAGQSGLLLLLTAEGGGSHADLAVLSEVHGYAASSLPIADLAIAAWVMERAGLVAPTSGGPLIGVGRPASTDPPTGPMRAGDTVTTRPIPMAADLGGVCVVGADHSGYLAVEPNPMVAEMTTLDLTRTWGRIRCSPQEEAVVGLPAATVDAVRDALAVHRALDAIGAAARLLEMTIEYAGQREQFGARIGSFQAVKHHCADMALAVEAGRATLHAAARALDEASAGQRARTAAAAVAYGKAAASRVAGTALQVHGGIGFTWEHDLHLLLRRIKVDEALDGTVAEHRAALAMMQTHPPIRESLGGGAPCRTVAPRSGC